jgi:electron transport complex protein RnfB
MSLLQDIERVLPQTQCQACGFNGCRPYAQALASGVTTIDKCPPGGVQTLKALARLLKVDAKPYLESFDSSYRPPSQAKIDEKACIGCAKCIKYCPVDAIIGTAKHMHYVIPHECTGCGLCVEPCPVDCIDMVELSTPQYDKDIAKQRYEAKIQRLDKRQRIQQEKKHCSLALHDTTDAKLSYIQQALMRVKQKNDEKK